MKNKLTKKMTMVFLALLLLLVLCSCGKTVTKKGERVSVSVKGLNTKAITIEIKGDISKDDVIDLGIPQYDTIEETEDGKYNTVSSPLFATVGSKVKKGKAVCKLKPLAIGDSTINFYIISGEYGKHILLKLDVFTDENLKAGLNSLYLDERKEFVPLGLPDNELAYLCANDNGNSNLHILSSSSNMSVEGYDAEIINVEGVDSYIQSGFKCTDIELSPLSEGACSLTVIDNTNSKRYIAGISVVKDIVNADIGEYFIIKLDSIESEDSNVNGSLDNVNAGGTGSNEYQK